MITQTISGSLSPKDCGEHDGITGIKCSVDGVAAVSSEMIKTLFLREGEKSTKPLVQSQLLPGPLPDQCLKPFRKYKTCYKETPSAESSYYMHITENQFCERL